jgi:hypothetical protein
VVGALCGLDGIRNLRHDSSLLVSSNVFVLQY